MGKSKRTVRKKPDADAGPSFEESLSELQQIVEELEDGSLGLQESMQRFEKGISLLRNCYKVLEEAEQKIEILTGMDADGNPLTTEFDATATLDRSKQSAPRRGKPKSGQSDTAERPFQENDEAERGLF